MICCQAHLAAILLFYMLDLYVSSHLFAMCMKAYEGKTVNEATFYSCMKEILGDDEKDGLLDDFVAIIRPEDSSDAPVVEEPIKMESFPFDRKPGKSSENQQQNQHQQQQNQQHHQRNQQHQQLQKAPQAIVPPLPLTATLSSGEVLGLVKTAVNEKAKVSHTCQVKSPPLFTTLHHLSYLY